MNWAGDEPVSVQEWCAYIGELGGFEPVVNAVEQPGTLRGSVTDNTRRLALAGPCKVSWRDGIRDVFESKQEQLTWAPEAGTAPASGSSSPAPRPASVRRRRSRRPRPARPSASSPAAPTASQEVLAECREHVPWCQMVVADLSKLALIDDVAAEVTQLLGGGVDVLVNNAGVPKRRGVRDLSPADVEGVMAMNYFSPVRLTLALLPGMLERDHGDIVNVSSMGAHMVAYKVGAYSASKAALEMFTESLHVELAGTGVRAHTFVPGTTTTEFSTPKEGNDPPFPTDPATAAIGRGGRRRADPGPRRGAAHHLRHGTRRGHVGEEGGRPQRLPRRHAADLRRVLTRTRRGPGRR